MDPSDLEGATTIPRITHQIWFQGWDKLPDKFHDNVQKLHILNRDWNHMKWDEQSLRLECQKLGEPYLKKFDSFDQMILKIDYGRYVVLYNYGGISVDTDMFPLKPLHHIPELHTSEFIIGDAAFPLGKVGIKNNAVLCVRRHHPIMKDVIDTIVRSTKIKRDYLSKELQTNAETGPPFLSSLLEKYKGKITVISHIYFEPCLATNMYCTIHPDAILDHRHAQSWKSSPVQLIEVLFFYVFYNWIWILFGICIPVYLILFRSGIQLRKNLFGGLKR